MFWTTVKSVALAMATTVLAGCTYLTPGPSVPTSELAPAVDPSRYAGRWYIIANIPYFAERGKVASRFDIRFDGNAVEDVYVGRPGFDAPESRFTMKGYVVPGTGNARWRESPMWPIYFSYLIHHVDEDYRIALVGYPGKSLGWILARDPTLDEPAYQAALNRFAALGYDPSKFRKVPQIPSQAGLPGFQ